MKSFKGETVDICIVGSGAGGGPIAYELARAGASVVVLEKGPWHKEKDFTHDEIATVRRDFFVPFVADEPHLMHRHGRPAPVKTSDGWIARCVGGGTVHMSGFVYRLHPEDFRMKTRYGALANATLADWPITYEELAPWYDKVETAVGVSGKAGENPYEPPRAGPYPYPPVDASSMAALVDQGAAKLGLHPFQTPRAILTRQKGKRKACVYCRFCGSYGCEVGAKGSTAAALIPGAVASGRCEVRPDSMAFEIAADATGKATGVRYHAADGTVAEQKARVVIVSASSIESARLLLNSTSAAHPDGLANSSGLVGRNLSFSTLAKAWGEWELSTLPKRWNPDVGVHFLQRSIQDYYFLKDATGYDKGGTLNFLLPHANPIHTADRLARRANPPLWGAPLKQALYRFYKEVREIELEVFGEFLPNPRTKVTVDGATKDKWGIPVATIHLWNHPLDVANSKALAARGEAVLKAAGAGRTAIERAGETTFVLQHGTARFGADPKASVLNKWCRAHDTPNLYVVDGSFMPTSGGVPTTLTIMANAFRVADHLVRKLKARDL